VEARRLAVGAGLLVSIAFGALVALGTRPDAREQKSSRSKAQVSARAEAKQVAPRRHERPVDDRPEAPPDALNVVLVIGCTVRRDQLTPYGAPATVTPFLGQLAVDGARFDDALSVSSWTRESVVGLLTGTHPASLGLPDPGPGQSERALHPDATMLAELLSDAGWMTLGVTANPNLNVAYGMAQGMDRHVDATDEGFKAGRTAGVEVVAEALGLLDARTEEEAERPFMLQVVLIDAHHPRRPSQERLKEALAPGVSPDLAAYRASLREVDHAIEQLDRGLRSRGSDASNTLFVFVTDHGEGLDLPPHHSSGHGKKMYPSTVAIPWIVRGPGIPAGRVVPGLVSGVDVTPTLIGLLGLHGQPELPGRDWSEWVRGSKDGAVPQDRAWSLSMFHGADVAAIWTRDRQCQAHYQNDRDKDVSGCFDRAADPDFSRPFEDVALRKELDAWRKARLTEGKAFDVQDAEAGEEVSEQLEVLGYLGD
jgi:arylsulfatase A-like enzyme